MSKTKIKTCRRWLSGKTAASAAATKPNPLSWPAGLRFP